MPTLYLIRCLLTGLGLVVSLPATAADPHDHHQHAPAVKLELDHGKKWGTDAPLRQAMSAMRAEMSGRLQSIHKGTMTQDDYAALGMLLERQVGKIVSECKLAPKADAMLHIVIADIAGAAEVMQGKAPGAPAESAHQVVVALNSYGQYFSHPGWKPVR